MKLKNKRGTDSAPFQKVENCLFHDLHNIVIAGRMKL